jgi:hypothetical protein
VFRNVGIQPLHYTNQKTTNSLHLFAFNSADENVSPTAGFAFAKNWGVVVYQGLQLSGELC